MRGLVCYLHVENTYMIHMTEGRSEPIKLVTFYWSDYMTVSDHGYVCLGYIIPISFIGINN